MNTPRKQSVTGSCLCGDVTFSASLPSKWCGHCHCSMCQQAHGAGYVTWAGFDADQVQVDEGSGQLAWYESSPGAQRGFCKRCGSTMFFVSERWAGELHITLANFNEALDRRPAANAFFDAHVDWMPIDRSLKQLDG